MGSSRQIRTAFVGIVASLLILVPAVGANAATVKVVRGNTLSGIARTQCGDMSVWPTIWHDNPQIKNPNLIYPGQHIVVNCPGPRTPQSVLPVVTSGWVNPIRPGFYVGGSGGCWGAARKGHSHQGVDLTVGRGTPIHAVHAGKVVVIKYQAKGAGNYVVLSHGSGIWTVYMHLRERTFLNVGATVATGQTIGYVGATGNATGPHLHFEVHVGGLWDPYRVNPAPFMRQRGAAVGC